MTSPENTASHPRPVSREPSSAGTCATCGKWADKRYGGEGKYLPECIDCWTREEPS